MHLTHIVENNLLHLEFTYLNIDLIQNTLQVDIELNITSRKGFAFPGPQTSANPPPNPIWRFRECLIHQLGSPHEILAKEVWPTEHNPITDRAIQKLPDTDGGMACWRHSWDASLKMAILQGT